MTKNKVVCVIPARYSSTRLPGKPLALIGGKPMIEHTYTQVAKAKGVFKVIVATDDEIVKNTVEKIGGEAMLTSPDHATGSDRVCEVANCYEDLDIVINVQGDEPFIQPEAVEELIKAFEADPEIQMATLMTKIREDEINVTSTVKVITDLKGDAIYFSRSVIPNQFKESPIPIYKHLGIYAYRKEFLNIFTNLRKTPLEQTESLEQLRALEHGYKIRVLETKTDSIGIDTPEDLELANRLYEQISSK
ncbi:3-deoxy-manno-octulosonate cytidylyltransferase [Selenomonadales bacterium OttesenSCG-928-I06]|nr:3-deoxy-manno-octulosonate cytidylyltransferase [Selenomonadales bacterium OttesenSCG-928-I06]